ncbi:MAG TPA: galactose-1-phosphate uridylyltransferase [Streptosporangiaceae bacterium]|jgi:UDPglucose--hexose-1-phosphate uridylyltransferase|nr:galactose-1-phosphate uridylyltransferase [Streptosporangiaceae bacterium]
MPDRAAPAAAGQLVWRGSGRLADGREIIYYDESPGSGRASVPDTRDLTAEERPVPGPESGLRWDPLTGEWVIVAGQRQGRTFLPPAEHCPLDPSRPGRPTEIPAPDYDVVVFENRFPSLYGATAPGEAAPEGQNGSRASAVGWAAAKPGQDGLISTARPAFGRCEVVCFTAEHEGSFADLPPRRVRTVLEAWADRSAALAAMPGIAQVFCFENRGEEIGVTLHHPHGQIYAYPFVTPRTAQLQARASAHAAAGRGNLFDDVLAAEVAAGTRLVAGNGQWTAFVPAAARWPYEILIFPDRRVPDLPSLDEDQRAAFGPLYTDVLGRLRALFDGLPPYIAAWYQAPAGDCPDRDEFALHLRVMSVRRAPGKLKYLAGSESAMGVWINDVVPETAARRLRDAR